MLDHSSIFAPEESPEGCGTVEATPAENSAPAESAADQRSEEAAPHRKMLM